MEVSWTGNYVFVLGNLGNGGAEMNVLRLSNVLSKQGVKVTLILARCGGNYEKFLNPSVKVIHVTKTIQSSSIALLASLVRLPSILKSCKASMIMSVLPWPNIVVLLLKKFSAIHCPVVINVQNTPIHSSDGAPSLEKRIANTFSKWLYGRADGIVTISAGIQDDISKLIGKVCGKIQVIHNIGFDRLSTAQMEAGKVKFHSDVFNIVSCGRLTTQKGYTYLLEAMVLLKKKCRVHLHVLGTGPLEKELKSQVNKMGIKNEVTFWGFQENVMSFMKAADLFVLPSLWEGFGNVIVEAMACGKAVVATDCKHGPAEILQDRNAGLLVPIKDPSAMAHAIYSMFEGKATFLPEMEANALERSKDFSAEKIGLEYHTLFRSIVES